MPNSNRNAAISIFGNVRQEIRGTPPTTLDHAAQVRSGIFALPPTHRVNPHFIGKPDVQTVLTGLQQGDTLVLQGMPGVGKTQHAVQHAHENRRRFTNVFWASADSQSAFISTLASCAQNLTPEITQSDQSWIVTSFQAWLSTHSDWLLIIDNVDCPELASAVERFLPAAHDGKVIITARITTWTKAFKSHCIEPMDETEAVAFLAHRLGIPDAPDTHLHELAIVLYGLPLALEHAAAYVEQTSLPVDTYLRLIRRDRKVLLSRGYPGMTAYKASVAATLRASLSRLSFLSRFILRIAACFASDPIPRHCFDHLLKSQKRSGAVGSGELDLLRRSLATPHAVDGALAELASYSLISLSNDSLRIHALLQTVVRDFTSLSILHYITLFISLSFGVNLPRSRKEAEAALWPTRAATLLAADDLLPTDQGSHEFFVLRGYIPHCQAVLDNLPPGSLQSNVYRMRLEAIVREYRRKAEAYTHGVDEIVAVFCSRTDMFGNLRSEIDWFAENFGSLCQRALQSGHANEHAITYIEIFSRCADNYVYLAYDNVCNVGTALAQTGDVSSSSRLFEICAQHAREDHSPSAINRGFPRIQQVFALFEQLETSRVVGLLEEGLSLFEARGEFSHASFLKGAILYARLAETTDSLCERAERWLSEAQPFALYLLRVGFIALGILVTSQQVKLFIRREAYDDALAVLEKTLSAIMRPARRGDKQRGFCFLGPLWEARGNLLRRKDVICRLHGPIGAASNSSDFTMRLRYGDVLICLSRPARCSCVLATWQPRKNDWAKHSRCWMRRWRRTVTPPKRMRI